MEKRTTLLAALLGAQLLLALALLGAGHGDRPAPKPLLDIAPPAVGRITLEGPQQARVVLERGDDGWRLPEAGDFPADGAQVGRLLERLAALRTGTPAATSEAARKRFRVAEDDFERRITVAQGEGPPAVLYLGTSPGLRRIHARDAGQDAIYAVEFAAHEAPATAAAWQDKALLQVPREQIAGIAVAGLQLTPPAAGAESQPNADADTAAAWRVEGAGDARLDPQAAARLAGLLAGLRFEAVLGQQPPAGYALDKPALALTVTRRDGAPVEYRLGKGKDGDDYVLKVSTRPEYFRLAAPVAGPLLEAAGRDALLDTAAPTKQAKGGATQPKPSA